MNPRPLSPRSRENRFNVTNVTGSTGYPVFLSSVAQVTYANPPISPEARITLPTKYADPKALNSLLSDCISEALTDLIGSRVREAIYDYMDRKHSVNRNEVPEHLDSLFTLFEDTFGVAVKKVIGRTIAEKLYVKLGWKFESFPSLQFADYIDRIKTKTIEESE